MDRISRVFSKMGFNWFSKFGSGFSMTGYCFQGVGLKTGMWKNRKFKSLTVISRFGYSVFSMDRISFHRWFMSMRFFKVRFNGGFRFFKERLWFSRNIVAIFQRFGSGGFSKMALLSYTQGGKKALEIAEVFSKNILVGCRSIS
jgi:hypothetical protein